jgi:hypothetical protein
MEFSMSLNLTPNEFVGYRIKPDYYSFNVVIVKRHGAGSTKCGQEYEKPVSYCKNLASAVDYIVQQATRSFAEKGQEEQAALTGSVADAERLLIAMKLATAEALAAVDYLQKQLLELGLSRKDLVKALGSAPDVVDGGNNNKIN